MPKKLVLIVDDEPTIRETLAELLDLEGYETCQASNGEEALRLLESVLKKPIAILLDQMMPVMTGEQFMSAVKNRPELVSIPIILVSAAHNAQKIAMERGVAFVRKPLDADILLKAIEKTF